MLAWKTATGIMDVFTKRPFNLLSINKSMMPIKVPKNQRVATAIPPPLSIIHSKIDGPSYYSRYTPVAESINVVHYKQKPDKLPEMQEHAQTIDEDKN